MSGSANYPGFTEQSDPYALGTTGQTGTTLGTGTGQMGQQPVQLGQTAGGVVQWLWDWLNKPFTTPLDPTQMFLIVGVVIVSIIAWNMTLYHLRIAAEAI